MSAYAQFELTLDAFIHRLPRPKRFSPAYLTAGTRRCFIAIAGFEPRCLEVARLAVEAEWHADTSVLVEYSYEPMAVANSRHTPALRTLLQKINNGGELVEIEHNECDFATDFGERLLSTLSQAGVDTSCPETHIVLDITVGTSRLLLEGLHALLGTQANLTLTYSEASDYRPSFAEHLQHKEASQNARSTCPEFLSIGVERVELLHRIRGRSADARPTYLAAFPSFTPIRMQAVIEEVAPSRVHWLFGIPHLVRNRWRLDAQRDYHADMYEHLHRHCYVSTFDYRETLAVLDAIYQRRKDDYAMVVCSLGSKLQKVGQVLFHLLRPEAGAVVSVPRVWDTERFSADTTRAAYCIPLGPCDVLRRDLWRTRTFCL